MSEPGLELEGELALLLPALGIMCSGAACATAVVLPLSGETDAPLGSRGETLDEKQTSVGGRVPLSLSLVAGHRPRAGTHRL